MPPETKAATAQVSVEAQLIASVLEQQQRIEDKLDRLLAMAEKAERFIGNPIGAYKAARLGKLPRDPAG